MKAANSIPKLKIVSTNKINFGWANTKLEKKLVKVSLAKFSSQGMSSKIRVKLIEE